MAALLLATFVDIDQTEKSAPYQCRENQPIIYHKANTLDFYPCIKPKSNHCSNHHSQGNRNAVCPRRRSFWEIDLGRRARLTCVNWYWTWGTWVLRHGAVIENVLECLRYPLKEGKETKENKQKKKKKKEEEGNERSKRAEVMTLILSRKEGLNGANK